MGDQTIVWNAIKAELADGLWHERHDLIYRASKKVPPNIAIRWGEIQRERTWNIRHPGEPLPPRTKHLSYEERAMYGARFMIRKSLANNPTLEYGVKDGKDYIRRRSRGENPPPSNIPGIEILPPPKAIQTKTKRYTYGARTVPFNQLPIEEQKRLNRERIEKMRRTNLIKRGIDPDNYVTAHERRKQEALQKALEIGDDEFLKRSARSRQGWEKRRAQARQQQKPKETDG